MKKRNRPFLKSERASVYIYVLQVVREGERGTAKVRFVAVDKVNAFDV